MTERPPAEASDSQLIREIEWQVQDGRVSTALRLADATLARTLLSVLSNLDRLTDVDTSLSTPLSTPGPADLASTHNMPHQSENPFDTLSRTVSDLQMERSTSTTSVSGILSPQRHVQSALLWSNVEQDLETVLDLCAARRRPPGLEGVVGNHLPPEYDYDHGFGDDELPPEYEGSMYSVQKSEHKHSGWAETSSVRGAGGDEKMRMDLDAVTSAIDRLYDVCPQLHNQRVELRSDKRAQLERARTTGFPSSSSSASASKTKSKARAMMGEDAGAKNEEDIQDLQRLLDMLGRASERKLVDQAVVLKGPGGMEAQLERSKQRALQQKETFVNHLAQHSDARRLHDQDAERRERQRDPHALLTLPEFMREAIPAELQRELDADPEAMLTLPEFIRQPVPPGLVASTSRSEQQIATEEATKRPSSSRSRSLSAPPLAWLLSRESSRPGTPGSAEKEKERSLSRKGSKKSRPKSSSGKEVAMPSLAQGLQAGLEVTYVAEHHENLQHVLVFASVANVVPGKNVTAQVLLASGVGGDAERERLVFRCGDRTSAPLALPVRVRPGERDVLVQSTHYEVKIPTYGSSAPSSPGFEGTLQPQSEHDRPPLLDAQQLTDAQPTSFICASCSLPLVAPARAGCEYRDLPSEHWAELVDAWMCHTTQKLNEQVVRHGKGIWPHPGEALVGGSYVLFDDGCIVKTNLAAADEPKRGEDWRLVRCLCGAVAGRCKDNRTEDGTLSVTYRLAKYAIRPVSSKANLSQVPLSAFIVEDMVELVQAHATYRFVIFDEEDERPRLLIWLFKPSIRLAYTTPAQYLIPRSGTLRAAKTLWKILGPNTDPAELPAILDKYPGFPQAEHLFYPMSVCRRLAAMLKESSGAYPESVRVMCGLEVGWLKRA
ncbi:hypothetical protein PUNSTDRAFT_87923 [Punctularia strigosozonata HHB-11173 SS5]|uniref:uncharacterized protein n=1 Tax=Punctularia strigosozonata (strain HHB-11173) TaxID=741275 RepID=UPI0004416F3E|nr:uncharacterized protein PUNSTDRAFT_87923 [Punctularia strigosozonata HHB-11173 SS5]EIN08486.1 hypothetical protein PUNSTDRAFT_87923 [Punctularia strigosozonata HHB-11173 SS5]